MQRLSTRQGQAPRAQAGTAGGAGPGHTPPSLFSLPAVPLCLGIVSSRPHGDHGGQSPSPALPPPPPDIPHPQGMSRSCLLPLTVASSLAGAWQAGLLRQLSHLFTCLSPGAGLGIAAESQTGKAAGAGRQGRMLGPDAASPVNGPELLELASHVVMDVVQAALLPEAVEVEPAGSPVTRQLVEGSRSWWDGGGSPPSPAASPGSGRGTSPQGAWLGRSPGEHGSGRREREARVASLLSPGWPRSRRDALARLPMSHGRPRDGDRRRAFRPGKKGDIGARSRQKGFAEHHPLPASP